MQLPYDIQEKDIVIFVSGAFVALVMSYIFYRLGLNKKQLTYTTLIRNMVFRDQHFPGELKIMYGKREIVGISRVEVYVWNSGKVPIRREDLVSKSPLKLILPDQLRLLQCTMSYQTRPANEVSISSEANEINFAFLNPKDGFVLTVFIEAGDQATAKTSRSVTIGGEIIGIDKPPIKQDSDLIVPGSRVLGLIIFLGGALLSSITIPHVLGLLSAASFSWQSIVAIVFASGLGTISLLLLIAGISIFFARKMPYSLFWRGRESEIPPGRWNIIHRWM